MSDAPTIAPFFHAASGSWSYVVHAGVDAVVIDPVLDYDAASACIRTDSARQLLDYIDAQTLAVHFVLETHAHADHLTAAAFLHAKTGATVAIGNGIATVQAHFANQFRLEADVEPSAFGRLLADGECLHAGVLRVDVMATPGHTPDGVSYRIGCNVFVGDTLFAPDIGTARCDFPGGSSAQLHASIARLHALPAETTLWLCHDYPPDGRDPRASVTVAESSLDNRMLPAHRALSDFAGDRAARDAQLSTPALLYPALQVNLRGGRLPPAHDGVVFLRTPVTLVPPADGISSCTLGPRLGERAAPKMRPASERKTT